MALHERPDPQRDAARPRARAGPRLGQERRRLRARRPARRRRRLLLVVGQPAALHDLRTQAPRALGRCACPRRPLDRSRCSRLRLAPDRRHERGPAPRRRHVAPGVERGGLVLARRDRRDQLERVLGEHVRRAEPRVRLGGIERDRGGARCDDLPTSETSTPRARAPARPPSESPTASSGSSWDAPASSRSRRSRAAGAARPSAPWARIPRHRRSDVSGSCRCRCHRIPRADPTRSARSTSRRRASARGSRSSCCRALRCWARSSP